MFLANFLIALREGVEAALLVGIIVAYLVKVQRRDLLAKLWCGIAVAIIIPLSAGAYMTWGPYTLSFQAQEALGGVLSLIAVTMVTWMILWMGKHSHELAGDLRDKAGKAIALHSGSGWAIIWLGIISVGREGIETAVFVWATMKASTDPSHSWLPALGVLTGLISAVIIGWLIYTGAAKINLKSFFTVTGLLLILVAAGIVSYGIGDLQEASFLPGWGSWAYDLSGYVDGHIPFLHPDAWWLVLAEAMFNLNLSPTHLQAIAWFMYLLIVLPLFLHRTRPRTTTTNSPHTPITADATSLPPHTSSPLTK